MSYKLFLDDFRKPADCYEYFKLPIYLDIDWVLVCNYCEFVNIIQNNGIPEIISFDHDIYYEDYDFPEKTGYDCAKWLIYYCIDNKLELPKEVLIHSMNAAGSANIKSLFESYYKSLEL
jgi:hypothetical protein